MRADDRRRQLLDAAAQILVEDGAAAMSMERLAARAGVSKALPYKHFANSEAVLAHLYRRETEALGRAVWHALSEAGPDDDLIRLAIRVYFDEVSRRGPVLAALSRPGSTIPSDADPSQAGVVFEVEVFDRFHGLDRERAKAVAGMVQGAVVGASGYLAGRSRHPGAARGRSRRHDHQPGPTDRPVTGDGRHEPGPERSAHPYQPLTSMMTLAEPCRLNTLTLPSAPSLMVAALGTVWPAVKLRLDPDVGWALPVGHSCRNDDAVTSVTVTFNTAASASAGTPPNPPTCTSRAAPAPHGVANAPTLDPPARESSTRPG